MNEDFLRVLNSKFGIAGVIFTVMSSTAVLSHLLFISPRINEISSLNGQISQLSYELRQKDSLIAEQREQLSSQPVCSKSSKGSSPSHQEKNESPAPIITQMPSRSSIAVGNSVILGNVTAGQDNEEQIEKTINNLREILRKECLTYRKETAHMIDMQKQAYSASWNYDARALPKFSDTVKEQFSKNDNLIQSTDPKVTQIISMIGNIDYQHVYALRNKDGMLYKDSISQYMRDLHGVCEWVSVDLGHKERFN
uniref:Uncharacterized protein n=1 Tax=Candidatus Kentrum sp. FW TaxID=2126338 RepID=A0A450RXL2_9GAMM|nr:MAG: hypothetical protein BECKFW1821A_GA0114235_100545 [Candidatus Kentron sp. FW]